MEAILCQRPDLFLHYERLLRIDAEGGDDAEGIRQWMESDRPRMWHVGGDREEGRNEGEAVRNGGGCGGAWI